MEKYQFTPLEIEDLEKEGFTLAEIPKIKQTVYFFEDWLKGDPLRLMDGGCGIRGVYVDKEGFSTTKVKENYELFILPETEWQKIRQRKAEVFNAFEDDYTKALIEDFERSFKGSKEGNRLIKQQIEALEKVLFTYGQGVQYQVRANGWGFTLYSFTPNDSGSIYKWYDEVCVKNCNGLYEPQTIVSPRQCSLTSKELALEADTLHYLVAALACKRFKSHLQALLESCRPMPIIQSSYCCKPTLEIMQGLVSQFNVSQSEVGFFEDFFDQHYYTNLGYSHIYRDKTTDDLDFEKLQTKIFDFAGLFSSEVQDYFFSCFFKDAERENSSGIGEVDYHILRKKIEERRRANTQTASQMALALSYFYQHESGELDRFTTTGRTKTAEIKEIASKHKVNAKNFELAYNKIPKKQDERLNAVKLSDFVRAIQLLSNSPKAQALANEDLEQKKSKE